MRISRSTVLLTAGLLLASGVVAGQEAPAGAAACAGVTITPASNIQNLISANPTGTTFCFASGTYTGANTLIPKNNDVFDGNSQGAVLNGGNNFSYAFTDGGSENPGTNDGASSVTIQGFKITDYAPPQQKGVITAYSGQNWIIQNNNITGNSEVAVATGDGVQVLNNSLDSNAREAFSAQGTGGLYQGNDISGNNANLANDGTFEAGGGKAWQSTNLTFKNNTVNNNGGPGIWVDTNNIGTVITDNTVDNNWGPGIYEEISYNFTITGNDVEGNGTSASPGGGQNLGWAWDAGIQDRLSQGINGFTSTISGNTVYDNYSGINLIQSPSNGCTGFGEGKYGACTVQNVTVSGNGVSMNAGATGGYQDGAGDGIFTSQNNKFTSNNYCVNPATHGSDGTGFSAYLQWLDSGQTFSSWQGDGNDATGTYTATTAKCLPPGPQKPVVVTQAATGISTAGATLKGTVNPESQATTYHFEYGTNTSYGTTIPIPDGSAGSGSSATPESTNLTGLTPGTTYHFRLDATNATGTTQGSDQQFTTSAAGGVVYGATGPGSSGAKVANNLHLNWNQAVSGSNTAVLAEVALGTTPGGDVNCGLSVTDNGVAMTKLAVVHDNGQDSGYFGVFGLAGTSTGTNAIAATVTSGCHGGTPKELTGGSMSFTGVSQSAPFGTAVTAFGSGTSPSVTAVSTNGNLIAGFAANGSSITSATAPSSSRYIANQANDTGAGNSASATSSSTGSNVTMKWTVINDWWGAAAMEVQHA